jgi:hypothetical protein
MSCLSLKAAASAEPIFAAALLRDSPKPPV